MNMIDDKVKELTDIITASTHSMMTKVIREVTGSNDDVVNRQRCKLIRPMSYPGKEVLRIDGKGVLLIGNPVIKETLGEQYRVTFELTTWRLDNAN